MSLSESEDGDVELEEHPSATWISAIARGTVEKYVMNILKIPRLTERATQQLAIDIGVCVCVLMHSDSVSRKGEEGMNVCSMRMMEVRITLEVSLDEVR